MGTSTMQKNKSSIVAGESFFAEMQETSPLPVLSDMNAIGSDPQTGKSSTASIHKGGIMSLGKRHLSQLPPGGKGAHKTRNSKQKMFRSSMVEEERTARAPLIGSLSKDMSK